MERAEKASDGALGLAARGVGPRWTTPGARGHCLEDTRRYNMA